jgi:hypothetical protein
MNTRGGRFQHVAPLRTVGQHRQFVGSGEVLAMGASQRHSATGPSARRDVTQIYCRNGDGFILFYASFVARRSYNVNTR